MYEDLEEFLKNHKRPIQDSTDDAREKKLHDLCHLYYDEFKDFFKRMIIKGSETGMPPQIIMAMLLFTTQEGEAILKKACPEAAIIMEQFNKFMKTVKP